jgi:hypothetical protein
MYHWLTSAALLALTATAVAQDPPATPNDSSDTDTKSSLEKLVGAPLTIDIKAGAWLSRIDGTASNGSNFINFGESTSRSLGIGNLEAAFRGEMTISSGEWGGRLMGAHGKWSGEATVDFATAWGPPVAGQPRLQPGQQYDSSLEMSWMGFELLWNPWSPEGDGDRNTLDPLEIIVGPNVGANWLDIKQTLDNVDTGSSWWTAYGGGQVSARVDLRPYTGILHSMEVDFGASVGSTISNGGYFWKIRGGLTLNFTPNIGAEAGYRIMEYKDLMDGNWEISPRFPGLFIALDVRF